MNYDFDEQTGKRFFTKPTEPSKAQATIPIRYYNVIRNCGDAITSYILENSFGITGRVCTRAEEHLIAIGSIFFMANPKSHIWGSGVLNPNAPLPEICSDKIYALRGKKTVAHLKSLGYSIPDVPLGDPGILVDELITLPKSARYRAAVIPHHTGFNSKKWDKARQDGEYCVVDMMDDTLLPLHQIAESEVVISQSLHGLIFAAALGKPDLWVSGQSSETWNWKFLDWFSTCDNAQREPILLNISLEEMVRMAEVRPCISNRSDLKAAFPSHLANRTIQAGGDFYLNRLLSPLQVFLDWPISDTTGGANLTSQQFAGEVARVRSNVFKGYPEPTYLAITHVASAQPPDRTAILAGQRFLDENRTASFVWYEDGGATSGKNSFTLSDSTFGESNLQRGTLVIRPDGSMGLNQRFAYWNG